MPVALRAAARTISLAALLAPGASAFGTQEPPAPPPASPGGSKFRSPEDGWLDVSGFLDEKWGFVPLVIPITEPAVGYGAVGALAFIGAPKENAPGFSRPSISVAGGLGTENGTWGAFGADYRHWKDNRLQTLVALFDTSVNLEFFGIGTDDHPEGRALAYNLHPIGGLAQAKARLGASRAWVGLSYAFAVTDVAFDVPDAPTAPFEGESRVGGLTPSLTWDSRETIFTPSRGTYVELSAGFFDPKLGGDDAFQRVKLIAIQYVPVHPRLVLGLRGDVSLSYGDVPFYLRPYVTLRGAPKLRYQGERVAQIEGEVRWQFWKRFSLVGFAGDGGTWSDLERAETTKTRSVLTGGAGFRYELARKYKLHMGLDVAFGPDATALYVQFGSAWMRP